MPEKDLWTAILDVVNFYLHHTSKTVCVNIFTCSYRIQYPVMCGNFYWFNLILRHRKLSTFCKIMPSDRNRCVLSGMHACQNSRFWSVEWFREMLFTVFYPRQMETDVFLYLLTICFAGILYISSEFLFYLSRELPCFPTTRWIVKAKISTNIFGHVQIQLNCLIYSLIGRVSALQSALVMMRVSGQSLVVSVSCWYVFSPFSFSQNLPPICLVSWSSLHWWFWCIWNC